MSETNSRTVEQPIADPGLLRDAKVYLGASGRWTIVLRKRGEIIARRTPSGAWVYDLVSCAAYLERRQAKAEARRALADAKAAERRERRRELIAARREAGR